MGKIPNNPIHSFGITSAPKAPIRLSKTNVIKPKYWPITICFFVNDPFDCENQAIKRNISSTLVDAKKIIADKTVAINSPAPFQISSGFYFGFGTSSYFAFFLSKNQRFLYSDGRKSADSVPSRNFSDGCGQK
jgi:hypothetical protein